MAVEKDILHFGKKHYGPFRSSILILLSENQIAESKRLKTK